MPDYREGCAPAFPARSTPQGTRGPTRRKQLTVISGNRPATDFSVPMYQFIYAAQSDVEARHILATRLQASYRQPFEHLVPRYCTAGAPDTCRASLQAYVDAGVREFILTPPVVNADECRQQLDLYAAEILPKLTL